MLQNMEEYAYLWDGTQDGWVLIKASELRGGYFIFNLEGSIYLLLEDEELNALLCARMRDVGCEVLDDLPRDMPEIVAEPMGRRRVVLRPARAEKE